MKPLDESVFAIVGFGLMGGSLALALRAKNPRARIVAIDRDAGTRAKALARGLVNEASEDLAVASQADLIVLATPVRTILAQLPRVGEIARAGAVVIDLGSTKREIARAMEALPTHVQAIGGHPMCGKESAGLDAADGNLFRNAVFVLTPLERTTPATVAQITSLVTGLGARPRLIDSARHDKIAAAISHLPFVLASALMSTTDELARTDDLVYALAAPGFRDTSRLAASDSKMMSDILFTNCENVANVMRDYARHLNALAQVIEQRDQATLYALLEQSAIKRRELYK